MENNQKPPLGLVPEEIWENQILNERIYDILDAMFRYSEDNKVIPIDWIYELKKRIYQL